MVVLAAGETRWTKIEPSERYLNALVAANLDAREEIGLVHTALITVQQLIHTVPVAVEMVLLGNRWQTERRPKRGCHVGTTTAGRYLWVCCTCMLKFAEK
jgi:hypothetical protein